MEIWIKHNNLIDFPYAPEQPAGDSFFSFDEQKITNLVSEIMLASPTCYLVSGYRGSGKTSFIRRVQEGCLAAAEDQNGQKGVLFVYSSFSRFESKTYFLRKLIRDLHEAATGWESKKDRPANRGLSELYKKTFQEIKQERSKGTDVETSAELSLEFTGFLKKLVGAFLPLLGPIVYDLLLTPAMQQVIASYFPFTRVLIDLAATIWVLLNAIKITTKYSIKQSDADKFTTTSLSDDEITEYDLERVLDTFNSEQYKIVFVLDELDKIEDEELDQLLREMKPWLVKGKADFILVAGQRLTMKYYSLRERDDELLASLFSKIIHIGPLTERQLFRIFKDFLVFGVVDSNQQAEQRPLEEFSEDHRKLAVSIGNSLIYRSRRLPRTFMNLIRQDLQWRNGQAFLPVPNENFHLEETKMKILRKLFEKLALNAEVSETGKSHIIMQLFRAASVIRDRGAFELPFNRLWKEIINPEKNPGRAVYPYPDIHPILKSCVEEFYQEAVKEKIVVRAEGGISNDGAEQWDEGVDDHEGPTGFSVSQTTGREALTAFDKDYVFKIFVRDFDTFIQLLGSLAKDLLPWDKESTDKFTIDQLLSAYVTAEVLQMSIESSVVLHKPIAYYHSRLGHPQTFKDVFHYFSTNNLSFNILFQQLFRAFTDKKLREKFLEVETVLQETSETQPQGQCKY